MKKGETMSDAQKEKVSASRKGKCLGNQYAKGMKPNSTSFKKGQPAWNKGVSPSSESISKRIATIRKRGGFISWNKGKKCPQMTGNTNGFKKGQSPWNKGIQFLAVMGEKNVNWKGGVTGENRLLKLSVLYSEWRRHVLQRDDYTCQACGLRGGRLHADHELPFAHYHSLRLEILNGRTLCIPCHRKTPTWGNKEDSVYSYAFSKSITAD